MAASKQWKDIIYLISTEYKNNKYGVAEKVETRRKVRANKSGTYASEFTAAGQNGIKLTDFMFTIRERNYRKETTVEYKGQRYGVYRTYPPAEDLIELHLTERGGLNGDESND